MHQSLLRAHALALALCCCAPSSREAHAQTVPELLGITVDGSIYRLDSATGNGGMIARTAGGWEYCALAVSANGEAWAARRHVIRRGTQPVMELDPELIRLGPDGENEPRWDLAEGELPHGLAFDRSGVCLGLLPTQPPSLAHYEFGQRIVTVLGTLAITSAADLAWTEGRWLLWSNDAGLFELDPLTLALVSLGPEPEPGSADFSFFCEVPGGRLLAGQRDLWNVDVFTGIATPQATVNGPPFVGADREGPHCWYAYGAGCAGSGGFTPVLALLGCAGGGGSLSFAMSRGPGGNPAVILVGLWEDETLLANGCGYYLHLLLSPVLGGFLSGENPGEGELAFHIPLPHGMRGFCNAQAFVLDPAALGGFTSTNAISVRVPF